MSEIRIIRLLCALNFLIILLLLMDNNLMIGKGESKKVLGKTIEKSVDKRSSHQTFFIIDSLNRKYKIPHYLYNIIEMGDSFQTYNSVLLNKPLRVIFKNKDYKEDVNIGVLNADWFGKILCIISMFLSLLSVFFPGIFKDEDGLAGTAYGALFFGIIIISFYLIF